jgi:lysophospholipase L1-like esterase
MGLTTCAACGLLLSLALEPKQLGALLCDEHDKQCMTAAEAAAAEINSGAESPDEICARIGLCPTHCALWTSPGWPPGNLPPAPKRDPANTRRLSDSRSTAPANGALRNAFEMAVPAASAGFFGLANVLSVLRARLVPHGVGKSLPAPCTHRNITCIIEHFTDLHLPLLDSDQDAFATTANRGLRGSHWRGADCNDLDASVYAGRRLPSATALADVDHDCNGISGGNASGTYEELLCSATARRGFIHIGDSATAHFHLPPAWLTRAGWTLDGAIADVLDELDWPACAWGSGYKDGRTQCPPASAASASYRPARVSLADRLRERNRCNHRDFQNIGVNGARMTSTQPLIASMARNASTDYPALVVLSLIGNDVCSGHEGTSHMTPPEEYRRSLLDALDALQPKLAPGSFVLLIGLVDGRVLWDAMHERQHPIGATYPEVYDYLTCNQCNPCNGWLTSNATFRNVTTAWAQSLNEVQRQVAANASFVNFEVAFYNPDFQEIIEDYVSATGGLASDLIEPSDGFHPSRTLRLETEPNREISTAALRPQLHSRPAPLFPTAARRVSSRVPFAPLSCPLSLCLACVPCFYRVGQRAARRQAVADARSELPAGNRRRQPAQRGDYEALRRPGRVLSAALGGGDVFGRGGDVFGRGRAGIVRVNFICSSDPHLFTLRQYSNSRFYWSTRRSSSETAVFTFTPAQWRRRGGLTDLNAAAAD